MKKLSGIAVVAAAVILVSLPEAPVLAENAPNTNAAPSTAATPTPAAPAPATTTEPAKGSKKKKVARMARHNAEPKSYLHLVPLEKMF